MIVKIQVLINIPNCFASFHALWEEYIQNICAIRFMMSPYSGNFREVRISHHRVKNMSHACMSVLNIEPLVK